MQSIWDTVPLSELCESVEYGYTASATADAVGPKFLRITDIVPDQLDWRSVPYCELPENKVQKYLLEDGDIVIARTGATVGYAKRIGDPPPAVFASYLVRLRINEKHDDRYVGLVVESMDYKKFILAVAGGAAQPNASAKVLTSYPVPLPPREVQSKVASVVCAYDALIENNLRRMEILEEITQAVYREWFVSFRFPRSDTVESVDSPLGVIPDGWSATTLGEVADIVMGQSPKSEFYNEAGNGLPFHQGVGTFGRRFPTTNRYTTVTNRTAEPEDVLFSVRAPVGRINVADQRLVVGRGLAAIRSKRGHPWFLLHQLKERFQQEDTMGGGTIFKAVTKQDVHGIPFLCPLEEVESLFEEHVRPMAQQIRNLARQNENLQLTRNLLLPKLVSGQIDLDELHIDTSWLAA